MCVPFSLTLLCTLLWKCREKEPLFCISLWSSRPEDWFFSCRQFVMMWLAGFLVLESLRWFFSVVWHPLCDQKLVVSILSIAYTDLHFTAIFCRFITTKWGRLYMNFIHESKRWIWVEESYSRRWEKNADNP
jgi:hypothetical protein